MTNRLDVDIATARHLLEDPALDRIIAAPRGHHQPERDALRVDILRCYGKYCIAAGPGTVGFNKRQADRLNSIRKYARKIARLLKEDDADLGIIPRIWPIQLLPLMVEVLDAMPCLQGPPRDMAKWTRTRHGITSSALQFLTGTLLKEVYKKHFGSEAKPGRDHRNAPDSPYIRFTRQVLVELRVECSDETIISALKSPVA